VGTLVRKNGQKGREDEGGKQKIRRWHWVRGKLHGRCPLVDLQELKMGELKVKKAGHNELDTGEKFSEEKALRWKVPSQGELKGRAVR